MEKVPDEGSPLRSAALFVAAIISLAGLPASAADVPSPTSPTPASGWIVTLGLSPSLGPRYDGAKLTGFTGSPVFDLRRADEPKGFSSPDDGFDVTLFSNDQFAVGPVFNLRGGRYRSADHSLYGVRDVPWTIEGGVFAEFWPIPDRLRMRAEVRHGFRGRADGFVGDFSVDWVQHVGRFTLSGGPRVSVADADYMDANFGVLPSEAQANGHITAFDAGPSGKSVGLAAALAYDWSAAWSTTAFVRYDRLIDDAAKSPIVKQFGSRDQFTVGTVVTYSFTVGQ
jgi:MipA family protein